MTTTTEAEEADDRRRQPPPMAPLRGDDDGIEAWADAVFGIAPAATTVQPAALATTPGPDRERTLDDLDAWADSLFEATAAPQADNLFESPAAPQAVTRRSTDTVAWVGLADLPDPDAQPRSAQAGLLEHRPAPLDRELAALGARRSNRASHRRRARIFQARIGLPILVACLGVLALVFVVSGSRPSNALPTTTSLARVAPSTTRRAVTTRRVTTTTRARAVTSTTRPHDPRRHKAGTGRAPSTTTSTTRPVTTTTRPTTTTTTRPTPTTTTTTTRPTTTTSTTTTTTLPVTTTTCPVTLHC